MYISVIYLSLSCFSEVILISCCMEEYESLSEPPKERSEESVSPLDIIKKGQSDIRKLFRVAIIEQWKYQVPGGFLFSCNI